ncbi:MAG: IS5 family transposase [Bacteroidetes bacterium]|nr:MAG: IS5 family transposase [Bacteroidota bacterium]
MNKGHKRLASSPKYVSPKQLVLVGFESPFSQKLDAKNRWVILADILPWDEVCNTYLKHIGVSSTGRPAISPRVVIASIIIKHICNLDDRETVAQISENMYMQYFLGYTSFSNEPPFDASLFVEFRNRMGKELINAINDKILSLHQDVVSKKETPPIKQEEKNEPSEKQNNDIETDKSENELVVSHKGRVLFDATACPQDIAYPTDINLLSDAREKTEELIDIIYNQSLHLKKPRTYRKVARKSYLNIAQKKQKGRAEIRKAIRKQLGFLKRNLKSIDKLLDKCPKFPLKHKQQKYLMVVHTLYQQQLQMYETKTHSVEHRIVSIHQPHVRPIVRGKSTAKVEFGSKIHVSLVDGYAFLDELSWDAFNEGTHMMSYIENYKKRFKYYPQEVLADQIYCTRENRKGLKEMGIKLLAKPLGRPSAVKKEYVRPGERNPIEGKFGQAKTGYGLGNIKARLKSTSESWIASIFMVLNLVKLAGMASLWLKIQLFISNGFSATKTVWFLTIRKILITKLCPYQAVIIRQSDVDFC